MANFKKLGEVTLAENASDSANVLIEESGEIKRVPKTEVGGGGVKTAVITSSDYNTLVAELQGVNTYLASSSGDSSSDETTYSCINMTFEEAEQCMTSGTPINFELYTGVDGVILMTNSDRVGLMDSSLFGSISFITLLFTVSSITKLTLYWTAEGISTTAPISSEPK